MQMGKTKVFLRRRAFEALELLRSRKLEEAATRIQAFARMLAERTRFEIAIYAATVIQKFVRHVHSYRMAKEQRAMLSVYTIQRAWRCYVARRYYSAALCIAWWCQSTYRGAVARQFCAFVFLDRMARCIQGAWRHHKQGKSYFRKFRRAITSLQNRRRKRLARRELLRLRQEARDLSSVAAERDKFKEESLRLRQELAMARTVAKAQKKEELDQLRAEVRRLQGELEKAHRLTTPSKSNESEVRTLLEELARREEELRGLRGEVMALRSYDEGSSIRSHQSFDGNLHSQFEGLGQLLESPVKRQDSPLKMASPVRSDISLFDVEKEPDTVEIIPNRRDDHRIVPPESAAEHFKFAGHGELSTEDDTALLQASIRSGDRDLFDRVMRRNAEVVVLVNQGDSYGRTALHYASLALNLYMAEALISRGAVVNAQDDDGETPLHLAENAAMTDLLLTKAKANPNIPNVDGICSIHLAVQRRDIDSVRVLLMKNADVNNADNIRWFTALHLIALPARTEGTSKEQSELRVRIAQLLTGPFGQDPPDLNYQDSEGNSPLHYAVQIDTSEASEIVTLFLEKGANPNLRNERKQTPLHLLVHNEHLRGLNAFQDVLHAMMFHGSDPNVQSLTGCTPLHLSLFHKDVPTAVQLMHGGAELHLLWKKVSF